MSRIELELPPIEAATLADAAAMAGVSSVELLAEALCTLPAFQCALASGPERYSAFAPMLGDTHDC